MKLAQQDSQQFPIMVILVDKVLTKMKSLVMVHPIQLFPMYQNYF